MGRSAARVLNVLIVPRVAESSWLAGFAADPPQTLLVGRQPLFLAAIASLLSSAPLNAEVRMVARTDTALEAVSQLTADLVLCEVRAVPLSGPELASKLREQSPLIKVVLLADVEDDEMLLAAIQSGATGFFTKACPSDEFLEGVRAVLAGHFVVGRSLVQRALGVVIARDASIVHRPLDSLSASERGILAMVGNAQSIATIAVARGISRKTVRNHLSNIYRKLGVRNRTEAVLSAVRLGLVNGNAPGA
jgi:DNA-binding NarL/FixJ family response regulator